MCTAITLRSANGANCLGRSMDFSYAIQPHVYFVPKHYKWHNAATGHDMANPYSFIGIGQKVGPMLGFADGVNEHGFAAAVLYFAGYAQYSSPVQNSAEVQIASYDFLHYLLGNCTSVADLCRKINTVRIVGMKDPLTQTVTPLHWIATDRTGNCVVLEQTAKGVELFNNSIGVLTNSPDFPWHMTNLRNYTQVSPYQIEENVWGPVRLTPFSQGGGTTSLPGGFTSPERFVRAFYLKTHIPIPENTEAALISFFQIIKNVSVPKGAVTTSRGLDDFTQYTAFIDTNRLEYFFNTYDNLQIKRVGFPPPEAHNGNLVDLGGITQQMTYENM